MKTYTIKFDKAKMEACGIRSPEKQSDRTQLWLLGMTEALSVVRPDIRLTTIVQNRWLIQFGCNNEELVARINERLFACIGATVEPLSPA